MLRHARETGGESSERYTACAICTCPEIHEQVDLARTWFMYLLWPFAAGSHQPSDSISGQATPTIDDTYGSLKSGFGRQLRQVNRRDGYRPVGGNQGWVTLIGAHILKRAVGVVNEDWILFQNMERLVDDSSNGIMLEPSVHTVFNKLKVYLERMEQENEYVVKEVDGEPWIHPRELLGRTMTFQNHAAPTRDLSLPNPHFIAIHAGIARILHMSGAAEVFAQILDKYDEAAGGNAGVLKSKGNPVPR
ncbi:hypothetical protein DFH29DRAFT_873552 [Suillus ampliporus]|nr:hypothetical protein DFH29DRAFT_873552 [Suillus ampliporus]